MRRVFIEVGEVPRLVAGALKGEPAAVRRILGARRGGRIGIGLFGVGLLLGLPTGPWTLIGAALLLGAAFALRPWPRSAPRLTWIERTRLSLWTTGPILVLCGAFTLVLPGNPLPGLLGVAAGQVLVIRGIRNGLPAPAP